MLNTLNTKTMRIVTNIIYIAFIGVVLFDFFYWNQKRINNAYERGYTEAMTDARNIIDSSAKKIAGPDTTISIYVEGKDTSYSIHINK